MTTTGGTSPPSGRGGLIRRLWQYFVLDTIELTEAASEKYVREHRGRLDVRTIVVCIVVALSLTIMWYFGLSNHVGWIPKALAWIGLDSAAESADLLLSEGSQSRFWGLLYWVTVCLIFYLMIPALLVRFAFKQSLREYGLSPKGALRHLKTYLVLFLIVLPFVLYVSKEETFLNTYPFYQAYEENQLPPYFGYWEIAYATQFFALEFFFRGFMIHGLKHRFGVYAVFVSVLPYCMIHFTKPFPETLGAVVAGTALGFLSLRTGNIWAGFLIHVSVALSMDVAALAQKGLI